MKKSKKTKQQVWKADIIQWTTCPHCKKIVMQGNPKLIGTLKKWKEQFNKNNH